MGSRNSSKVRKLRPERLRGGQNRLANRTLEMRFQADPRTLALPPPTLQVGAGEASLPGAQATGDNEATGIVRSLPTYTHLQSPQDR